MRSNNPVRDAIDVVLGWELPDNALGPAIDAHARALSGRTHS
jgi:hypothetical protein